MSWTIWKFPLPITDAPVIRMPRGAIVLHADFQPGVGPYVWAVVDPSQTEEPRKFLVCGTGNPLPFDPSDSLPDRTLVHIGTFFQPPFVWHVFDAGSES